ncbi:MAG: hypothetical protein PHI59_01275 [Candidatus Omnitrophica bacterium]|nr:hypothetical protein [Candidatus Omnitrophota bacterium]
MRKLIIAGILFLICSNAFAGENITVHVWVAGCEKLNGEVKSYLERELRSLGDVEVISSSESSYDFNMIVGCGLLDSGGIVISTVYVRNMENSLNRDILPHVSPEYQEEAKEEFKLVGIVTHNPVTYIETYAQLKKVCQDVVTDFDKTVLQGERKRREKY